MTQFKFPGYGNNGVPYIRDYKTAKAWWDRTPKLRGTDEKPAGKRSLRNRRMVLHDDDSVGFRYYDEEVARWHPNGEVTVTALSQQRQGGFERVVLPHGMHVDIGTRTGPIAFLCPATPNNWSYRSAETSQEREARPCDEWSFWQARTITGSGRRNNNPDIWVVKARLPVRCRLVDGAWRPISLGGLEPFEWDELDKAAARKVAQAARIPDFIATIDAITALQGGLPEFKGHVGWRHRVQSISVYEEALSLIEEGNFPEAMSLLRRDKTRRWDPVTQTNVESPERIVSTEIERIRTALYLREGVLKQRREQYLTLPEYVSCEGSLKRFQD